ncbi:MAG TPA: response regulator [Nitrososphaeraceae archaeon]|nr:response regulator [Nitrososphaeraceae archaeon]
MNSKQRILLVDDESDITFSFTIGLEDSGFEVDTFNNPLRALSNFKSDLYDLALLDIKMPEMNGIDLCKEIRKLDNGVRICFLTAFDSRYEEFRRYSECFIRKPITIDNLVEKVKKELTKN